MLYLEIFLCFAVFITPKNPNYYKTFSFGKIKKIIPEYYNFTFSYIICVTKFKKKNAL